jgi:hypothetical protein
VALPPRTCDLVVSSGDNVTKIHDFSFFSSLFMKFTIIYSRVSLLHNLEVPPSNITSDGSYRDLGSAHFSFVSHCGVVSVVTSLRAGRSGFHIPVEARDFSFLKL